MIFILKDGSSLRSGIVCLLQGLLVLDETFVCLNHQLGPSPQSPVVRSININAESRWGAGWEWAMERFIFWKACLSAVRPTDRRLTASHERIISFVKLNEGSAASGYEWRRNERWYWSGPAQRGKERAITLNYGPEHSRTHDRSFTIISSGFIIMLSGATNVMWIVSPVCLYATFSLFSASVFRSS